MSNNKQTAVEWLINQIRQDKMVKAKTAKQWLEIFEQAKAMHKEEMIDFADNYVDNCVIPNENMAIPTIMDVPNYYNETYGGNK